MTVWPRAEKHDAIRRTKPARTARGRARKNNEGVFTSKWILLGSSDGLSVIENVGGKRVQRSTAAHRVTRTERTVRVSRAAMFDNRERPYPDRFALDLSPSEVHWAGKSGPQ